MSHSAPPHPLLPDYIARNQWRFKEAVNHFNRESPPGPAGVFGGLFAYHWLRREIPPCHWSAILGASRNPDHGWLATLLQEATSQEEFITRFMEHQGDTAADDLLAQWNALGRLRRTYAEEVRAIQETQKNIAAGVGGELDRQRLALVDTLPAVARPAPMLKAGFIPRMACPQSCRHCMFVWRAPLRHPPEPTPLLQWINRHTGALLFTGGDLTGQLAQFLHAIRTLERIHSFAILLNGATITSLDAARSLFADLHQANLQRATPAEIVLQISFDEYHQEILANREGHQLRERIPVANIAHLVLASVDFPAIRLVLLHKQNRLNFSTALFGRGVFARLARALQTQGKTIQILRHTPSPRHKADPVDATRTGAVIREALFVLTSHPAHPILLSSSIIDGHGRAALLDPSEFVNERLYLQEILHHGPPAEERFDTDPMFRADGMVSCFAANHLWLGNFFAEGGEVILARWRKDPLLHALARFDPVLLNLYKEIAHDLDEILATTTGPHHLFHRMTEQAAIRLHMTERLSKH